MLLLQQQDKAALFRLYAKQPTQPQLLTQAVTNAQKQHTPTTTGIAKELEKLTNTHEPLKRTRHSTTTRRNQPPKPNIKLRIKPKTLKHLNQTSHPYKQNVKTNHINNNPKKTNLTHTHYKVIFYVDHFCCSVAS
jgi:uncharacterized protein (DUF4415 family)